MASASATFSASRWLFGVARNGLRRIPGQEHPATRVVDAHADVLLDQAGHIRDQGHDDEIDLADQVHQRRAAGRPAAAGEDVLVPVDRQMLEPLGLDHRRRHARVVTIAFDQRRRTLRRLAMPHSGLPAQAYLGYFLTSTYSSGRL